MTAAELMAELQSDPKWVQKRAELDARQKERAEQRLKEVAPEHAPLLAELTATGVKVRMNPTIQPTLPPEERPGETPIAVTSLSDLVNSADSYPEAIPILTKHLRTVRHPIMVGSIARSLTVKEARGTGAAQVVLDRLKQTNTTATKVGDEYQARWALANALTLIADKSMVGELENLVSDARYHDIKERLEKAVDNLVSRR